MIAGDNTGDRFFVNLSDSKRQARANMFEAKENESPSEYVLRVLARGTSVLCVTIIMLFLLGEDLALEKLSASELVGFLFFPVGVLAGLLLAWRDEVLGGIVTVASVAGFYLVYGLLLNSDVRQGWAFLVFVVPAFLFVAYGLVRTGIRHVVAHQ